jgi:asparagine synthase (glutamine-hydrolysing)
MVGLCGVLGDADTLPEEMAEWTTWGAEETTVSHADENVALTLTGHSLLTGDQPVAVDEAGDTLLWVWGDVYGHGSGQTYTPRTGPPEGSARFCADLLAERGLDAVTELNGDFAMVVYDREANDLAFVTDRIATRPIYCARPHDDALVFASNLQSLPCHPDVEAEFDLEYLYEYLQLRRVFGVETPLTGVRELPPGAVVTVGLDDLTTEERSYWRPRYEPVERPFSYFVDELASRFQQIFAEWTHDHLDYGLLLSGGSDSRLVQSCLDQPAVCFHNADWMSREARIARRIAEAAGNDFELLERYDDHEARSLETAPLLSNFSGWFDQAYFTEFEDRIVERTDVLVSGLFADMLFGGGALTSRELSLGPVGTLSLPVERQVTDIDDYVETKLERNELLPYFEPDLSLREVLSKNITRTDGDRDAGIVSHGVRYESLTDLVMYGDYYPMGADTEAIFSRSLMQMRPYRTPFLDNRIIDLHRRVPRKYFLRRNIVNAAIESVDPVAADIPHARTGVAIKRSYPIEYVGRNVYDFLRTHVHEEPTPEPHFDHDPWPDRRALLRARRFADDTIREKEGLFRDLPFLDYEGALDTVRAHREGQDKTTILYSLLTLLEMPLTERVGASGAESAASAPPLAPDGNGPDGESNRASSNGRDP